MSPRLAQPPTWLARSASALGPLRARPAPDRSGRCLGLTLQDCTVSATALRRPPLASLTQPPPLSYQSKRGGPNRSALCSLLRRTFQNLRHFTHRRLHVPLPLPSSRAFEKDSTQWTAGPSAGGLSCHGDRAAARAPLAETDRACPASIPPSPAWGQVAFQLTPVNNGSGTSVA